MSHRSERRRLVGYRRSTDQGWTWIHAVEPPKPRRRRGLAVAWTVYGLAALVLAVSLGGLWLALSSGGADRAAADPPQPHSQPATQFSLAQWADLLGNWRFGNLNPQNSTYREGEAVPFMLRIDHAVPGDTYAFDIRFDCAHRAVNGYDFLTSYDRDRGTAPALDADGPGGAVPDALITVPNDPSIAFDDGEADRTFKLWGASFAAAVEGPSPSALCQPDRGQSAEKHHTVFVTARSETAFLLWGGHLASSADWGLGKGAASISGAPYHMKLDVPGPGVGERDRSIMIGAAAPPQPTPSPSPSPSPSPGPSPSPSPSPTAAPSPTPTPSPTVAPSPSPTGSPTVASPTPTATASPTSAVTPTAVASVVAGPTATAAAALPKGGAGRFGPWEPRGWPMLLLIGGGAASAGAGLLFWRRRLPRRK